MTRPHLKVTHGPSGSPCAVPSQLIPSSWKQGLGPGPEEKQTSATSPWPESVPVAELGGLVHRGLYRDANVPMGSEPWDSRAAAGHRAAPGLKHVSPVQASGLRSAAGPSERGPGLPSKRGAPCAGGNGPQSKTPVFSRTESKPRAGWLTWQKNSCAALRRNEAGALRFLLHESSCSSVSCVRGGRRRQPAQAHR